MQNLHMNIANHTIRDFKGTIDRSSNVRIFSELKDFQYPAFSERHLIFNVCEQVFWHQNLSLHPRQIGKHSSDPKLIEFDPWIGLLAICLLFLILGSICAR